MKKSYRFLVSVILVGTYLLSACSGAAPQQEGSPQSSSGSSQSAEAVFTGTVEAMGGAQWLISGQQINVDGSTSVDSNIKVGDIVKVEASVAPDGIIVALSIEASRPDSGSANDNTANGNDSNTNDDNANTNTNDNTNSSNDNSNTNVNSNDSMGTEQEAYGVVEAITTDSITIGGVTYGLANFTEFKNLIAVGDQVKIHVIVNADGTLTIREIEKSTGGTIGDDNGNSNDDDSNSNDDNSNDNSNDDDDDDDDNSNSNSNDDDDDNSNDSNSNDD